MPQRPTPYLAVDVELAVSNIRAASTFAASLGADYRPHAKTHKTIELAQLQLDAGAIGLTVATIGEAEVFAGAGVDDLFIAYPLWVDAVAHARLRALTESGVRVIVGADSAAGASRLAGTGALVRVEVDSGHGRSGVLPTDVGEVALAAVASGLIVDGVFTFPGHAYEPDAAGAANDEAIALRIAADMLVVSGIPSPRGGFSRSGGSTPSFGHAARGSVTELRPGVNVTFDAGQWELGTVDPARIALWAESTVVSVRGTRIVLDAGSKTLGADRAPFATGFGRLLDVPDARIVQLSEHHAVAELPPGLPAPSPGTRVRVAPNHVCTAINLHDELVVVGPAVDASGVRSELGTWRVAARGKNA